MYNFTFLVMKFLDPDPDCPTMLDPDPDRPTMLDPDPQWFRNTVFSYI